MQSIEIEKIILHYCRKNPHYFQYAKDRIFENNEVKAIFKYNKLFFEKYKTVATQENFDKYLTVLREQGKDGETKMLDKNIVERVYDFDINEYEPNFLEEVVHTTIEAKELFNSFYDAESYLKTVNITPQNIREVKDSIKKIINERNSINFNFELGSDFYNPESHRQYQEKDLVKSGYPFIDTVLGGGFAPKTFSLLLGVTNVGKSLWLTNLASNFVKNGNNVLYISLEMSEPICMKRIGSNLLDIPVSDYKRVSNEELETIKQKIAWFSQENNREMFKPPGALYAKEFPTGSVTVDQIKSYIKKLEEITNINFHVILFDYINLIKSGVSDRDENSYFKIKSLSEELRGAMMDMEKCGISVTQLNKAALDTSNYTLANISESFGLAHTCDSIFGIIQSPEMLVGNDYWLQLMKNRDGGYKGNKAHFKVDYSHMRITQRSGILDERESFSKNYSDDLESSKKSEKSVSDIFGLSTIDFALTQI